MFAKAEDTKTKIQLQGKDPNLFITLKKKFNQYNLMSTILLELNVSINVGAICLLYQLLHKTQQHYKTNIEIHIWKRDKSVWYIYNKMLLGNFISQNGEYSPQ